MIWRIIFTLAEWSEPWDIKDLTVRVNLSTFSSRKIQIKSVYGVMWFIIGILVYFWLKFWIYEQARFILNNSASLRLLNCPCAANRRAFSSLWRRARSQRVSEGSWGPGFTFGGGGFVGALVGGGTGSGCFGGLNSCEFLRLTVKIRKFPYHWLIKLISITVISQLVLL